MYSHDDASSPVALGETVLIRVKDTWLIFGVALEPEILVDQAREKREQNIISYLINMLRTVSIIGKKALPALNSARLVPPRSFSTLLGQKEKGDEERYFREQDQIKKAELRASFERILAEEGEKKAEILELLSEFY